MTGKTVLISDIKAEIGPHKILDLEKVVDRAAIDRSPNLRQALQTNRLRLVKHSVVKSDKPTVNERQTKIIEKTIEREKIDEDKLASIIRSVMREESAKEDIEERVNKVIAGNLREIASNIRKDIQSGFSNVKFDSSTKTDVEEPLVDPAKLAELQQKSIEKISEDLEISDTKKTKSIRLINKNVDALANEL